MSLAIASVSVAALGGCSCGTCAACAARPVMRAETARVATANAPTSTRTDSFTPSGEAPPSDEVTDSSASVADAPASSQDDAASAGESGKLTVDEQRMVSELQARDRAVRAHEAAHQAVGGGNVGGASYSYQQGPDGRQYAIGGEVSVNLSTGGGSPEAVIAKMAQVQAAAMAPADPSPQDFAVAAAAIAASARQQQAAAKESDSTEAAKKDDPRDQHVGATTAQKPALLPVMGGSHDDGVAAQRKSTRALGAYRAATGLMGAGSAIDQRA